jgi:hypothetical protein
MGMCYSVALQILLPKFAKQISANSACAIARPFNSIIAPSSDFDKMPKDAAERDGRPRSSIPLAMARRARKPADAAGTGPWTSSFVCHHECRRASVAATSRQRPAKPADKANAGSRKLFNFPADGALPAEARSQR